MPEYFLFPKGTGMKAIRAFYQRMVNELSLSYQGILPRYMNEIADHLNQVSPHWKAFESAIVTLEANSEAMRQLVGRMNAYYDDAKRHLPVKPYGAQLQDLVSKRWFAANIGNRHHDRVIAIFEIMDAVDAMFAEYEASGLPELLKQLDVLEVQIQNILQTWSAEVPEWSTWKDNIWLFYLDAHDGRNKGIEERVGICKELLSTGAEISMVFFLEHCEGIKENQNQLTRNDQTLMRLRFEQAAQSSGKTKGSIHYA